MGNHETPKVGLAVALRRQGPNGTEVLFGLRKGSHAAGVWALPGGHLDLGETIPLCGAREVLEETGIVVGELIKLPFYYHSKFPGGLEYITLYLMGDVPPGTEAKIMEPHKCEEWIWVPKDRVPNPLFPSLPELMKTVDLWA